MFRRAKKRIGNRARGFSLLEVLIASVVFVIGATAVLGTITVAALTNAGHGVQGEQATEYATAMMEDQMKLKYSDLLKAAGTTTDYIVDGATSSTLVPGATFQRQCTISASGSTVTISVTVTSLQVPKWGNGTKSIAPSTTLVGQKMNYNPDTN